MAPPLTYQDPTSVTYSSGQPSHLGARVRAIRVVDAAPGPPANAYTYTDRVLLVFGTEGTFATSDSIPNIVPPFPSDDDVHREGNIITVVGKPFSQYTPEQMAWIDQEFIYLRGAAGEYILKSIVQ